MSVYACHWTRSKGLRCERYNLNQNTRSLKQPSDSRKYVCGRRLNLRWRGLKNYETTKLNTTKLRKVENSYVYQFGLPGQITSKTNKRTKIPQKSTLLRKLFVPAKNIKYQLNLKTKKHLH